MAEFQELMKEMRRMCAYFRPTCNGCPLCLEKGTNEFCGEQPMDILSDPALVEAAVMQWAAEHPEPVYPTWEEWLQSVGVMESSVGLLRRIKGLMYIDGIPAHAVPTAKVLQPMDADIAQKLGLQPKEG